MADPIHIALIDDDSAVLDSLQLYFARRNVQTACFESAEALLAALDHGAEPDCIVSDVRMPGMSGLDLVRRLNARRSIAPVILITGLGDIDIAVAGLSNKEIGSQLNISPKTVENHRAWVMERIGAKNLAELVRIAMQIDRRP